MTESALPDTPWRRGRLGRGAIKPALLFGRMLEDWWIERSRFPENARVFAIASAGCTALALAAEGAQVTAVDINPAQVDYVRNRMAGVSPSEGAADRLIRRGRVGLHALGVLPRGRVRQFLMLEDPAEQEVFWQRYLRTTRLALALRLALSRPLLRLVYVKEFLSAIPPNFPAIVSHRLERTWRRHPNRTNPYAWRVLLGEEARAATPRRPPAAPFAIHCADAADYLESVGSDSFDAFTLSNILDGVGEAYSTRLRRAIGRAAAPTAAVVLRSFAEPKTAEEAALAAADRSLLWGRVLVTSAERFAAES